MGVAQEILDYFVIARIKTMGAFAWSSAFQPGQPDETPFLELVRRVIGRNADDAELSSLRRLYYESHTLSISDMRNRVERTDDSKPSKILPAERASRHTAQQARISGIVLSGPNECSHSLIDKIFQMLEDNVLRYIPLDEATTREQELMGEKKASDVSRQIEETKDGFLKSVITGNNLPADLDNDLKIKEAFTRRGLGFDQAGLISFPVHQAWIESLFHKLSEQPPPNYRRVSMAQVILADKKLFVRMAEATRAGICPVLGRPRPLDLAMNQWSNHHEVQFLLAPLAGKAGGRGKSRDEADTPWREEPYQRTVQGRKGASKGAKGRSKGRGKGNKSGKGVDLPPGCVAATPDGRRICFGFNRVGGCPSNVSPGSDCIRGSHICGKCFANHSAANCTHGSA